MSFISGLLKHIFGERTDPLGDYYERERQRNIADRDSRRERDAFFARTLDQGLTDLANSRGHDVRTTIGRDGKLRSIPVGGGRRSFL